VGEEGSGTERVPLLKALQGHLSYEKAASGDIFKR